MIQLSRLIEELQGIVKMYPGSEDLPVKFTYINDDKSGTGIQSQDIVNVSVIASIKGLEFIELQEQRTDMLYNIDDEELIKDLSDEIQNYESSQKVGFGRESSSDG